MLDMKKLKVMSIVGTRPEIIRLSRVFSILDEHVEHIMVHTGQNYDYELNEIFFKDLKVKKPDYFLEAAGKNAAATIGNVIISVDNLLEKLNPHAILVLGDTNSSLSVLPAKRRKIPTFHMEAGNRCFDDRVPEEINRRLVDHIADINLTYSSIAREYLISEGLRADRIIKTGSPMYEVLNFYKSDIERSTILKKLKLKKDNFFLVSAHREENIDSKINFQKLVDTLNSIAERFPIPIIFSTHPRTRNKIDKEKISFHKNIQLLKPLGFLDYNNLQINAKAVLSDSGTITEESSILNFPALNIRESHERPEGMEKAAVMMVGLEKDRIFQALQVLESNHEGINNSSRLHLDYEVPNVSEKVLKILLSYTDYINRVVWRKS